VQGWLLPHLIAWVSAQGCDTARLRAVTAGADLTDPDLRVPESMMEAAWQSASTLTGDPAIGIHVAEFLPRGAFDLVEYAFRSSDSVRTAIERLARYGRVVSDRVAGRMESATHGLLLVVGDTGGTPLHGGRADCALAIALKLTRECAGQDIAPRLVCFAHDAPADTSEHQRFFRAPVQFRSGTNSMMLDAADAARPLHSADAALEAIVRRRLEKALSARARHEAGPLSARVRRAIVDALGRMIVTPDAIAHLFGISRRTLSRHLAQEKTSFSEIFDDVRMGLAQAMVQDRGLSVADIAFFLQYSEPSAFHRSFRRWTGKTPRAFRSGG
jgi:AraC-like DNA-binding protein